MPTFVTTTAISVDGANTDAAEACLCFALDNLMGDDLGSYDILTSRQQNDFVVVVTTAISVHADDEAGADRCLESALYNLVGGDIRSFDLLETREHERDAADGGDGAQSVAP